MSKVSRSAYQKVVEENKRLLSDVRLLVEEGLPSAEKILCIAKWRDKFEKDREFNELMKLAAKSYMEKFPNDPAVIAVKELTKKEQ